MAFRSSPTKNPSFASSLLLYPPSAPTRYDDALERLPPVWKTYLADGWLKLATAALRRVYVCAWRSGKVSFFFLLFKKA